MVLLADKPTRQKSKTKSSGSPSPQFTRLERTKALMRYLMTEHGLSQMDLSKACGFSHGSVSLWFNGKVGITDNNADKIANYLAVRKERLIDYLNGAIEFEEVSAHFGEIKTIAADPEAIKAWMREIDSDRIWDLIEEGTRILRARGS